jgi:type II secretory pathway component PulF
MTTDAAITFSPMLGQISGLDSSFSYSDFCLTIFSILFHLIFAVFFIVAWIGTVFGSIYLIHFFFTLPMRRAERARLFLDLLEGALNRGQSVEEMILSVTQSRDQTVGVRFHLLAAHIEAGLKFGEALEKAPRFLPPQISAMLQAGMKLGDLKKVLPACREILRDRPAAVRSAMHYLILVVLLFSPVFIFVVMMTMTFVVPRFKDVAANMGVGLWPLTTFVFALADSGFLIGLEVFISLLMFGVVLFYIGGPQFARWFQFRKLPLVDWIAWHIPWKQKRLQRTFSAMLAVLLDGGVPEAVAVSLAGDCTANEICRRRSQRVVAALEKGVKLDEAVRALDASGEFQWRLTNATHAHGGFLNALRGWHEALDARAFQQEEATAHIVSTGVVILNGALVALIATAMFGILLVLLNAMVFSQ